MPRANPQAPVRTPKPLALLLAGCAAAALIASCAPEQPTEPGYTGPAQAPAMTSVVAGDGQLTLNWQRGKGANSYTLYWSANPGPTRATATKVPGIAKTTYTLKGLTNGSVYYFLVSGSFGEKESESSTAVSGMPLKVSIMTFPDAVVVVPQPTDTAQDLAAKYLKDANKAWMILDFNEIEQVTPFQALTVPLKSWDVGGLTATQYQTVPVLTYHRFTTIPSEANRMTVIASSFEAQMKYLKDNGYVVIPLAQFVEYLNMKAQLPEKAVVITADDGWESFYLLAFPILKKYGYPSTLFVYTDFPESDPLALKWPQVRDMAKGGVDIECHSKSHRNLKMQKGEDPKDYLAAMEAELKTSQAAMQQKAGVTCNFLAYPFGARNHLVVALAQKYGFKAAFTVARGSAPFFSQDFQVNRSMVYGEYGLAEFENNLTLASDKVLQ